MSVLEKATLQEIPSGRSGKPQDPIEVQFNPTTLKLKLSNKNEGGRSRGRQVRQHLGASSTILSMDLIFDTSDEGTTDNPVSVHTKTALVEKFVLPKKDGKDAPPRLRFHWGNLILDGVVESIDIDFDHFAADGVPLRAKVSLSINGQDPKYEYLKAGAGSNETGDASDPGESRAGEPGSQPAPADRSAPALEGETLPEFAARMGLDPQAWRGLQAPLGAGLALAAGVEVGFKADLSLNVGVGVQAGIEANLGASLEASFGLSANVEANSGAKQGFALSAAGGVSAAAESVRIAKSAQAAAAARAAFSAAAGDTAGLAPAAAGSGAPRAMPPVSTVSGLVAKQPGLPEQVRTPLGESGLPSLAQQAGAPPAPPPPQADGRAVSFGFGVPLRPRVGGRSTVPVVVGANPATRPSAKSQPAMPCGCRGPCHCGGSK